MKKIITLSLLATLALPSLGIAARQGRETKKERMDVNDNGKIERVERKRATELREKADQNDDGKIDKTERQLAREKRLEFHDRIRDRRQEYRASWDERADRNGDNVVDQKEKKIMAEIHEMKMEHLDLNNDGKLSDSEWARGQKIAHEKRLEYREKMLEKADTDGDGVLSEDEKKVALEKRDQAMENLDRDNNGKLDLFEISMGHRKNQQQAAEGSSEENVPAAEETEVVEPATDSSDS